MKPIIQVALDFVDWPRALKVAREAYQAGIPWLEAGTPLIKACGLEVVRRLKKEFPRATVVADMKVLDAGRIEAEIAFKAGADIVVVMANASDLTLQEAVKAAKNYGGRVLADLMEESATVKRAREVVGLGVDFVGVHIPIDEQMTGRISFDFLKQVVKNVRVPVAIAGGLNSENAVAAVKAGAGILVVGGAITKSENVKKAVRDIRKAVETGVPVVTKLYKRVSLENVREILLKVSTANISDALHRKGWLEDVRPVVPGVHMAGPAVTVRTYPGDWAKPVEAVDLAKAGEVIVIDAGGCPPAVWGELATHSCLVKKIAGVVIYGGIRDVQEVRKMRFPAFATLITPSAGEPKGLGEIGVPLHIAGQSIAPGDWLVGDEDGMVVIPREDVVEVANRAMDVLEKENRVRREIKEGGTLSQITEVLKWEKPK